jgi:hypothetical protein
LSRGANKGLTKAILVGTRTFAYKTQSSVDIADAKNRLRSIRDQLATACTVGDLGLDNLQSG